MNESIKNESIIRELRLEEVSIEEVAREVGRDYTEFILYVDSHPGTYRWEHDFGRRSDALRGSMYLVCTWYKVEEED